MSLTIGINEKCKENKPPHSKYLLFSLFVKLFHNFEIL